MAAYLIADIDVIDAEAFAEYRRRVPETEERYGGRYLGRGGETHVLDGEWQPNRLVIIEFPDMERLLSWYSSPEYAPLIELRHRCARSKIVALEGVPTPG